MTTTIEQATKGKEVTGLNPPVTVRGMVHAVRDMGSFAFVVLRRAEGLLQCVIDKDAINTLPPPEACVEATGTLREDPRAQGGAELQASSLRTLSSPWAELPFSLSKRQVGLSLEKEIGLRPLTLRNLSKRALFKLQEGLVKGMRRFLEEERFTEVFTPKIVASGAEGGANIFSLDYFGKKAYLAQSPQFYKQMLTPVYGRVFEIAPVFRAEKHDTARHLNEYISVDLEMGFIDGFEDIMAMEERMLAAAFGHLERHYAGELDLLRLELPQVLNIPRLRFHQAKESIAAKYGYRSRDPHDLEPEEERLISRYALEEYGSQFAFITHYPSKKRPFYAMDDPADPSLTLSFDLLFRGLEVTTGGQRIHDYQAQRDKMQKKGLDPEDFSGYLMLHKYGCPPHGGLGLGLERLLLQVIQGQNIRQTSMFPRDTSRLTP